MNFNLAHGELVSFLQSSASMRSTASGSLKAGLIAGGGALAGGVFLGPLGAMIGGIVGSVVGYIKGDPYDGAVTAVTELPAARRDALLTEVSEILIAAGAIANTMHLEGNFMTSLEQFASQPAVRDKVWSAVVRGVAAN
ncbi:hypothetical protein TrRE_jg1382 [Triparma retinervis]|uniref:Uncharacterized protein n=1 Tax=Triparma retinervis TaxID=2557542 RepID=A0A9W7E3N0_9STRA|nr:hypothetical protein TrRE_jg1382 [Triparma retinervis]